MSTKLGPRANLRPSRSAPKRKVEDASKATVSKRAKSSESPDEDGDDDTPAKPSAKAVPFPEKVLNP